MENSVFETWAGRRLPRQGVKSFLVMLTGDTDSQVTSTGWELGLVPIPSQAPVHGSELPRQAGSSDLYRFRVKPQCTGPSYLDRLGARTCTESDSSPSARVRVTSTGWELGLVPIPSQAPVHGSRLPRQCVKAFLVMLSLEYAGRPLFLR